MALAAGAVARSGVHVYVRVVHEPALDDDLGSDGRFRRLARGVGFALGVDLADIEPRQLRALCLGVVDEGHLLLRVGFDEVVIGIEHNPSSHDCSVLLALE